MARLRRQQLPAEARRANAEQLARAGAAVREGRLRRRWIQRALAERVGLHQSTISRMERGMGGGLSVDAWQRVAIALDRRLRLELPRDPRAEPADAGHLAIQELVLRIGTAAGFEGRFELPTRPTDPTRSVDVGLIHRRRRMLLLVECVNTIGDLGSATRSFERKLVEARGLAVTRRGGAGEARDLAVTRGGGAAEPAGYLVGGCWVVRATRANRDLLARYPHIFAARFPGSSVAWLRTLETAAPPPALPGLVWCDVAATRLFAVRAVRRDVPMPP